MPNASNVQIRDASNNVQTVSTLDQIIAVGLGINANGAAVSPSNPVPMFDAYLAPTSANWTSATGLNTAFTLTTGGMDTVILTLVPTGTITAGSITFEAFDGTNWVQVKAPRTDSYATDATFLLTGSPGTHSWQVPVAGYPNFRARLSVAIVGSGSVGLVGIVSSAPDTSIVTVGLDPAQPLPAGQTFIGNVGGKTVQVTTNPTVTITNSYGTNYVVGGLQTFANAFTSTGSGIVQSVKINMKKVETSGFTLFIFDSNPSNTAWTDAAVAAINAADVTKIKGIVPLNASNALGTHTHLYADNLGIAINAGATTLYGILVANAALTNQFATTGDITNITLEILQDC